MNKEKVIWTEFEEIPPAFALEVGHVIHTFSYLELVLKNVVKRSRGVSLTQFRQEKKFREFSPASLGAILNGITARKYKIILWGFLKKPDQFYIGLVKEAKENPVMKSLTEDLDKALKLLPIRKKYSHTAICKDDAGWFFDGVGRINLEDAIRELQTTRTELQSLIKNLDGFLR